MTNPGDPNFATETLLKAMNHYWDIKGRRFQLRNDGQIMEWLGGRWWPLDPRPYN